MRLRLASLAAALSVLGLFAWLVRARRAVEEGPPPRAALAVDAEPRGGSGGSAVPCQVPLAWRIARVDPEFGIADDEAARALAEAMALWEAAVGRDLFRDGDEQGWPVRLVYDDRQARTAERQRLESEVAREAESLEVERAELDALIASRDRETAEHEGLARDLAARLAAHNESVRRWNERGGAPPDTVAASAAAGEALERERASLQDRERELEALRERVRSETARFQERVDRYNASVSELERRFPPTEVESGLYREAVLREPGRPESVSREIRIHRFDDHADLVRVLAHELGHALGLGHAGVEGGLMSEAYGRGRVGPAAPVVGEEDVRSLGERCPGVGR